MDSRVTTRHARAGVARAGLAVTVAGILVNLTAYLVPLLGARHLEADDLGALATAMALVAIATMPGVGLQTAVAVAIARGWSGSGAARVAWTTAGCCGAALLAAGPVLSGTLRLPAALPLLLAAMAVPAVLVGWPLGVLQGRERFGGLAAGMVLLAVGRYGGVAVALLAGAGLFRAMLCGALLAWLVLPVLLPAVARLDQGPPPAGLPAVPCPPADAQTRGGDPPLDTPPGARAVLTAAGASLALLVASYADLILARRILSPADSGAYAVGAVLSRAAIWAPQVITVLALPKLARERGRVLSTGLAALVGCGVLLVSATALAPGLAVAVVGGRDYAGLAGLAPWFVVVGALYAVTAYLVNVQLAGRARWPAAPLWAVLAGLVCTTAVVQPKTVGQLLACAAGGAAAGALGTGAAVRLRRGGLTAVR